MGYLIIPAVNFLLFGIYRKSVRVLSIAIGIKVSGLAEITATTMDSLTNPGEGVTSW